MAAEFASVMAGAASAHQAAAATHEDTSQQRAGRRRRTSAEPQRAQHGATVAAAPAALDTLSCLQQLADASPQAAQLRRLQALADASPQAAQLRRLQALADAAAGVPSPTDTVEAAPPNRTGLPDGLKAGVKSLSGLSMDHVRVHYNSAQPAQLNALAYAQGGDIHLAPGQERHLPHEAWHVVQQAQGRVRPTMQMKDGVPVNDDAGLEHEADEMGSKALEGGHRADEAHRSVSLPIETAQRKAVAATHNGPQTASLATVQCFKQVGTGAYDLEGASDTDYFFKTQSVDPELIKKEGKYRVAHAITRTDHKQGLLVSEDNTLAINDTQEQAKEFYGAAGIVGSSNKALEAAKSKVRLKESGELSLHLSGGTLKKITPTPDEETVQGAAEEFAKLGSHICIEMASSVMGSGLHEAVFQRPGSEHETVVNISSGNDAGDPMINTLGEEFVNSPRQVNTGSVRTNLLNKPSPNSPGKPYGMKARTKSGKRKARQMGINEYASPEVGEGYATYTLAASETKHIDYLQTGSAREALQSIWGYHYAAVVAKSNDGKDTVTLENYRRDDDVYKLLVEVIKQHIEANAEKFNDTLLAEVTPVDGDQRSDTQSKLMRVLEKARGITEQEAFSAYYEIVKSYAADESWFFKMQSQKKGQSFHEQQTASGAFVNPLTLRVRPQDNIREGERTAQLKWFNAISELPTQIAGLPAFKGMKAEMNTITKDIQQAETFEDIGLKASIAKGKAITAILKRILTAIMEERASTGSPSLSKAMEHFNGAGSVALKASLVEKEGENAYFAIEDLIQSLSIFNVEQRMAYSKSQALVRYAMQYAKSLGALLIN